MRVILTIQKINFHGNFSCQGYVTLTHDRNCALTLSNNPLCAGCSTGRLQRLCCLLCVAGERGTLLDNPGWTLHNPSGTLAESILSFQPLLESLWYLNRA